MANQKNLSGYLQNCKKYKKFNYKELAKDELDYLHGTDLKILAEVQKVFKKHSIRYCAVGGTLLGAFTTQHFIPWDEDIDIAVFEEDYDRMIDALIDEVPEWIEIQCRKTDENYYHEWIKACDKNSAVYPNNGVYKYQGCWVDIYKLRKMERREVELNIALDHRAYLLRRLEIGNIDQEEFDRRMAESRVEERIDEGRKTAELSQDFDEVYLIGTASKPFVEAKYVFPLKEYPFENTSLTSFGDAEAYLTNHYGGNFRELPPEEDRCIAINKVVINKE